MGVTEMTCLRPEFRIDEFAGAEFADFNEGLAVGRPVGVVICNARQFDLIFEFQMNDVGVFVGLVLEGAGDNRAFAGMDFGAGAEIGHLGVAHRAHFRQLDVNRAAGFGIVLFDPSQWPKQIDPQPQPAFLGHVQTDLAPGGGIGFDTFDLFTDGIAADEAVADAGVFDRFVTAGGDPAQCLWPRMTRAERVADKP